MILWIVVLWNLCCLKTRGMWIWGMNLCVYMYVECNCLWCWWYWDGMMLMLMMTLRCDDVDVDDVIMMNVCYVCTWVVQWPVGYPWRWKEICLKISCVLGEWRGLLRIFNYPWLEHWWCPCFILHSCMEIV